MQNKKNITIILLVLIIILLLINNEYKSEPKSAIHTAKNTLITTDVINKQKSIAQPNWWQKSSKPSMNSSTPPVSAVKNNAEPINNFLNIPLDKNWHQVKSKGIASGQYTTNIDGITYELSVIRMNTTVPFNEVLSIWKNKVGMSTSVPITPTPLLTVHKQNLDVYTLKGQQKTILLAVHKDKKYTFFRLLVNKTHTKEMQEKFEGILNKITIFN